MRSHLVVVNPPRLDCAARIVEALKPARVQALVAQSAVEGLDVPVLHRPAWLNEVDRDASPLRPDAKGCERILLLERATFLPEKLLDDRKLSVDGANLFWRISVR